MKYNYWVKSGAYSSLNRISEFGFSFISFLCLVRMLSKEEFGIWVLFMSIYAIIDMSRTGFLQNGMIRFILSESNKFYSKILTSGLVLSFFLTFIIILILLLGAGYIEVWLNAANLSKIIFIHCIALPFMALHTIGTIIMQAKLNFRALFIGGLFKSIPFTGYIIYAYFYADSPSLIDIAWVFNISLLIGTLAVLIMTWKDLSVDKKPSKLWIGRIFHFGKFVFGTNLISVIYNSLDKLLIGALLSPMQVAYGQYSIKSSQSHRGASICYHVHQSAKGSKS